MARLTPRELRQILARVERGEATSSDAQDLELHLDALEADDGISGALREATAAISASTTVVSVVQQVLAELQPAQARMVEVLEREVQVRENEAELAKDQRKLDQALYKMRLEKVWVPIMTAAAGAVTTLAGAWASGFVALP